MAYAVPPEWAHGDIPTAALLNKYSDALVAIKAILDTTEKNPATPQYSGADEDEGHWVFIHINRYLVYGDEAVVRDPVDNDKTASLPKPEGGQGVYDLDTIEWLLYGATYEVTGCAWALEDWEP